VRAVCPHEVPHRPHQVAPYCRVPRGSLATCATLNLSICTCDLREIVTFYCYSLTTIYIPSYYYSLPPLFITIVKLSLLNYCYHCYYHYCHYYCIVFTMTFYLYLFKCQSSYFCTFLRVYASRDISLFPNSLFIFIVILSLYLVVPYCYIPHYVSIYLSIYLYAYIHIPIYLSIHLSISYIHTYIHTYIHAYIQIYKRVRIRVCIRMHTYVLHSCARVRVCVCVRVRAYEYAHVYINVYTYTRVLIFIYTTISHSHSVYYCLSISLSLSLSLSLPPF
jgi:hypothetical protein